MALSISSLSSPKQNAISNKIGYPSLSSYLSQAKPLQTNTQTSTPSTISKPSSINLTQFTPNQQGLIEQASKLAPAGNQVSLTGTPAPQSNTSPTQQANPNFSGVSGGSQPIQTPTTQPVPTQSTQTVTPSYQPQTFPGLIGQTVSNATNNAGIQKAIQDIKDYNTNLANTQAGLETNDTTANITAGREAVLARQNAVKQGVLQTALQNALTEQGQTQSGLLGAAGLTAPHFNGYVGIDPQTGQPIGGQGGMNTAINQGAKYGAQANGAQKYYENNQSIQGAQNQTDSLTQLIQNSNLNPNQVNLMNEGLQTIQKNLSNSDYATLTNLLQTIGQQLGVDLVSKNNQEGGSLITTINNAIQAAKAQNAGNLGTQNNTSNNTSSVQRNSDGTLKSVSF